MSYHFRHDEDFTSVQEVQAGVTRLLQRANHTGKYYRVLKNNKPVGELLPNSAFGFSGQVPPRAGPRCGGARE